MILHKLSVWVAILSAALVSNGCFLLAGEVARPLLYRGVELPLIARVFYPDALWIYFYPVPLGVWALIFSFKGRRDDGHGILLITTTLGVSLVFLTWFMLGLVMPWIPGAPSLMPDA
jgi:hypothetical protein